MRNPLPAFWAVGGVQVRIQPSFLEMLHPGKEWVLIPREVEGHEILVVRDEATLQRLIVGANAGQGTMLGGRNRTRA